MANAAVDELKAYVDTLPSTGAPAQDQVRIEQLGRATGTVINPGVKYQMGILVFIITFALACAASMFFSRIRAGWRLEALSERTMKA